MVLHGAWLDWEVHRKLAPSRHDDAFVGDATVHRLPERMFVGPFVLSAGVPKPHSRVAPTLVIL